MTQRYGIEGKLFYCAAGIGGTPNWVEAPNLKNVSLGVDGKEIDLSTRANGGFSATGVGPLDASIEADMPLDDTDADYIAFETAFFAKSTIGIAVMSGGMTSARSRGLWADCKVTKFSREESADGAMEIKLAFKPTKSANAPLWKVIAAGTTAATGLVTLGGQPGDANIVVIGDGTRTVTFEFDNAADPGAVETGHTRVKIGADAPASITALINAINASALDISAAETTGDAAALTHETLGIIGNVAITKTGANITVAGMSGGA